MAAPRRGLRADALVLFAAACALYLGFSYGGLRSPDAEVAFLTAQALADHGTFAVEHPVPGLPGFGFAPGADGRLYSVYMPLQPLLLAPLVRLGELLEPTRWYERFPAPFPLSHHVTDTGREILGIAPDDLRPHALRFIAALSNVPAAALTVALFFLVVTSLGAGRGAALCSSVVFMAGTLNLPYAGTMMKEPLVGVFLLGATLILLRTPEEGRRWPRALLAGACTGCAVAVHVLSLAAVPFLGLLALCVPRRGGGRLRVDREVAAGWAAGLLAVLLLLAWHNHARFGGVLATGFRSTAADAAEQRFFAPSHGLGGLLFSWGKGLLWFDPAVFLVLPAWRLLHRRHRVLSTIVLLMAAARVLFLSTFIDWHGGFCLGPRYLVNLVPFLLLPLPFLLERVFATGSRALRGAAFLAAWGCVSQQVAFSLGEVFSYLHQLKWAGYARGVDIIGDESLYRSFELSPLLHPFGGRRGPFLLQGIPGTNGALFAVLALAAGAGLWLLACRPLREEAAVTPAQGGSAPPAR
jgi:hypothetical protein